jgi:type III pantothenate kinase
VVVSNVGGAVVAESLSRWLAERWGVVPQFARVVQDLAGLHTQYQYPEKLGVDRWLAALAGFHLSQGAVCVVDAGTALTIDVVTTDGQHLGGLIAPGLALMARSLTQGTAQLQIDTVQPVTQIANHTAAAISLGCREAVAGLLVQFAARVGRELADRPIWWVTGGEAATLLELSDLPLRHAPDLVLQGLVRYGELA